MKSKKTGHLLALLLVTLFVAQNGNIKAALTGSDKIADAEGVAAQAEHTGKVVHVIETEWERAPRFYAVEMHTTRAAALRDAQSIANDRSTIVGFLDPDDNNNPKFFRLHKAANGSVTYDKAFPPFLPAPSATIDDAVGATPPGRIRSKKSAGSQALAPTELAGPPPPPAAIPIVPVAPAPARTAGRVLKGNANQQIVINDITTNHSAKNVVILKTKSTTTVGQDGYFGLEVYSKAEVAATAENKTIFAFEDDDGTLKFVRRNDTGQFTEPFPPFTQRASLDAAAKAADVANTITHHKKAADGGLTAGEPVERLLPAPVPAAPARPARAGAPLSIQVALDAYKRFVESQTDSAGARLKLNTDFETAIRNFDRANPPTPEDIAEIEKHLKKLQETDVASQNLIRNIQRTVIQKLSADTSGSQAPDHWTSVGWVNIIKDYRDEEATALALEAALDTINPTKKAVSAEITELHKAAAILLQKYPVITYDALGNKRIRYNISDQEATDLTTALKKLPLIEDKATRAQLNTTLSEIETAMRNHFSATGYKIPSWPETAKGGQIERAKTDLEVAQAAVATEADTLVVVDSKTRVKVQSPTHRAALDLATKVLAIDFAKKTRWGAAEKAALTETMRKLKMYSENAKHSPKLLELFGKTESFVKTHMIVQDKTLDDAYDTNVTTAISGKQDDIEVADTFEISKPKNVRTIGKIQRPGWFKRNILRVDTPEEAALKIARKKDVLAAAAYENAQQLKDARKKAKVKVFWTKGDDNLRQHYSDLTGQIDSLQRQHATIIAEHAKIRTATATSSKEKREALERQQALAILANKLAQSHEKLMKNRREVADHLDKEGAKRRAALGIDDRDDIAAPADTIDDAAGVDGAAPAPARRTPSLEEFAAQAEAKQKYKQFIALSTRAGSGEAAAHTNIMRILDANPNTPAAAYQAARKAMEERIKTHRVDSDTAIAEALTASLEQARRETLAQKAWRDKAKIQREESVAALQKAQSELKRALAPQPPPRTRVPQAAPSFKGAVQRAVPGTAAGVAAHAQPPRAPNPSAGRRVAAPAPARR